MKSADVRRSGGAIAEHRVAGRPHAHARGRAIRGALPAHLPAARRRRPLLDAPESRNAAGEHAAGLAEPRRARTLAERTPVAFDVAAEQRTAAGAVATDRVARARRQLTGRQRNGGSADDGDVARRAVAMLVAR